jgi:hypothetical protein
LSSFIQITRHLYEEPHQLNLVIIASNGYAQGALEFYSSTKTLQEIGSALSVFPQNERSGYLYQGGSEYPEDRFGWYLRLRARALNSGEECLLQLRFNNNERNDQERYFETPQLTDFYIRTYANSLQRLGGLLKKFAKLKHQRLYWTPDSGFVDNNLLYRDRIAGDTLEAARLSLPVNGGVSEQ